MGAKLHLYYVLFNILLVKVVKVIYGTPFVVSPFVELTSSIFGGNLLMNKTFFHIFAGQSVT